MNKRWWHLSGQIGPEQAIVELEPHHAGGLVIDHGDEELPRRDSTGRPVRRQLAFLPHHLTQGVYLTATLPHQHVFDDASVGSAGLADSTAIVPSVRHRRDPRLVTRTTHRHAARAPAP